MKSLQTIAADDCPGVTDKFMKRLKDWTNITNVSFCNTPHLSSAGLQVFLKAKGDSLKELCIANSTVDSDFIAAFTKAATNITVLDLRGCHGLKNELPMHASAPLLPSSSLMLSLALPTSSLSFLDVSETPISDSDLMIFVKNNGSLSTLKLRSCPNLTPLGIKEAFTNVTRFVYELNIAENSYICDEAMKEILFKKNNSHKSSALPLLPGLVHLDISWTSVTKECLGFVHESQPELKIIENTPKGGGDHWSLDIEERKE
eukprot:CAMPEP_0201509928 /NCGR_PEP_ID=MMETSP0161_2-20130828/2833_1 /ASSEMBLY_ACC=CAM_ASM_000251 /TAXON_ID=180227 /ORGANISM="Neoparamoeba aestuarina, Strain SoJaBio B1-5/56/2" /LENGTH=259 /DNA_ID=CAMNT_0047905025 /DNA_START=535 /DNA_END=1314 /DNA_ORIENTATION=-